MSFNAEPLRSQSSLGSSSSMNSFGNATPIPSAISHAGYLLRRSRQHPNMWLKRFFRLEDNVLSYLHNASSAAPAWEAPLARISRIARSNETYDKFDFTLEVHVDDGTTIVLGSKNSAELQTWLSRLTQAQTAMWNSNIRSAMQIAKAKALSKSTSGQLVASQESLQQALQPGSTPTKTVEGGAESGSKLVAIKKSLSHRTDLARAVSWVDVVAPQNGVASRGQGSTPQIGPSGSILAQNSSSRTSDAQVYHSQTFAQQPRGTRSGSVGPGTPSGSTSFKMSGSLLSIDSLANGQSGAIRDGFGARVSPFATGSGNSAASRVGSTRNRSVSAAAAMGARPSGIPATNVVVTGRNPGMSPPTLFDPVNQTYIHPPPPPRLAQLSLPPSPVRAGSESAPASPVRAHASSSQISPLAEAGDVGKTLVPGQLFQALDEPGRPFDLGSDAGKTLVSRQEQMPPTLSSQAAAPAVIYMSNTSKAQLSDVISDLKSLMSQLELKTAAPELPAMPSVVEKWDVQVTEPDAANDRLSQAYRIQRTTWIASNRTTTAMSTKSTARDDAELDLPAAYPTVLRLEQHVNDLLPFIEAECDALFKGQPSQFQRQIFDRLTVTVFECTRLTRGLFRDSIYHRMSQAPNVDFQAPNTAYQAAYAVGRAAKQLGLAGAEFFNNMFEVQASRSPGTLNSQEVLVRLDDCVKKLAESLWLARQYYERARE